LEASLNLQAPQLISWAAEVLQDGGVIKPRLNAEQLLQHCTGRSRAELYAYPERTVNLREKEAFSAVVRRRAAHEPLQFITGIKGFRYLELAVDRRALIPRPETETVVERAVELLRAMRGHPVVVDVGTGCGCISLSIASECPATVVHATDISRDALAVARRNATKLGLEGIVSFHLGDLMDALQAGLAGKIDLIVSNPPYIRESDFAALPPEVREHEPYVSLVAGPEGTECHLRLMRQARLWLAPGGYLLMEGGEDQVEGLAAEAEALGYSCVEVRADLNGRPRMVEASL
jgi:release factor glutamine methyltransferase